jgi:hypothetical protein
MDHSVFENARCFEHHAFSTCFRHDHILKQKDHLGKLDSFRQKHDQFANYTCLKHVVKACAFGGDMPS